MNLQLYMLIPITFWKEADHPRLEKSLVLKKKSNYVNRMALAVKSPPANEGDQRDSGSIPGSGRSPRGGYGNPVQYSWLGNIKDRGTWQAMVHGVTRVNPKGRIRSNLICKHMCGHTFTHTHTHTHLGRVVWPLSSVQSLSRVPLFATPWATAH